MSFRFHSNANTLLVRVYSAFACSKMIASRVVILSLLITMIFLILIFYQVLPIEMNGYRNRAPHAMGKTIKSWCGGVNREWRTVCESESVDQSLWIWECVCDARVEEIFEVLWAQSTEGFVGVE